MSSNLSMTRYSNYFAVIFLTIMCILYVLGVSKGSIGATVMGVSCLVTHLFYLQQKRLLSNQEQRKLAVSFIISALTWCWVPIGLVYFLYLDAETQALFISLFHPSVLHYAFLSIGTVTLISFFCSWGAIKGYTYLLKKDKNKTS